MNQQNGFGEMFYIQIKYLHKIDIVEGAYQNRDKSDVLKNLRVVWKEGTRVNRVDNWCIVF